MGEFAYIFVFRIVAFEIKTFSLKPPIQKSFRDSVGHLAFIPNLLNLHYSTTQQDGDEGRQGNEQDDEPLEESENILLSQKGIVEK